MNYFISCRELIGGGDGIFLDRVELGDPDDATLESNGIAEFNGDPLGQAGQSEPLDGEVTSGALINVTGVGDGGSFIVDSTQAGAQRLVLSYILGVPVDLGLLDIQVNGEKVGEFVAVNNSNDWAAVRPGSAPSTEFTLPVPLKEGDEVRVMYGTASDASPNLLFLDLYAPSEPLVFELGDPDSARLESNGISEFNESEAAQTELLDEEITTGGFAFNLTGFGDGVSFVVDQEISSYIAFDYLLGPFDFGFDEGIADILVAEEPSLNSSDAVLLRSVPLRVNSSDWETVDPNRPVGTHLLLGQPIAAGSRIYIMVNPDYLNTFNLLQARVR